MQKKKILVADDDEGILDVLEIMLTGEGYLVDKIIRGEDLLELKTDFPDLILLDILMADIDGRDICKHLKNQPKTSHIPVIMVSANKDIEAISSQINADGFICKPFEMDDLLQMVADILKVS